MVALRKQGHSPAVTCCMRRPTPVYPTTPIACCPLLLLSVRRCVWMRPPFSLPPPPKPQKTASPPPLCWLAAGCTHTTTLPPPIRLPFVFFYFPLIFPFSFVPTPPTPPFPLPALLSIPSLVWPFAHPALSLSLSLSSPVPTPPPPALCPASLIDVCSAFVCFSRIQTLSPWALPPTHIPTQQNPSFFSKQKKESHGN